MKFLFDSNQDYQIQAINSVLDLFEGQPLNKGQFEFSLSGREANLTVTEAGVGNFVSLTDEAILENVVAIQERNGLTPSTVLEGRNFSIEMETGTGKTYVYLRTIYELQKKYGFKKFIIVVPSIAIREGVLKSLEMTREHFQTLYQRTPASHYAYDSKNLSLLRGFAASNALQILVINIDSFAKDDNIINKATDKLTGKRPIEFVRDANPIVILDEPQNMETPIRRKAIGSLNPACTLRYSATHTALYNHIYRLGPVQAYDAGLVKQIEVDSLTTEDSFNQPYIRLEKVVSKARSVVAHFILDVNTADGVSRQKVTATYPANLYDLSNRRELYRDNYAIQEIAADEGWVKFTSGIQINVGGVLGDFQEEVMKRQIQKTVEEHFEKELLFRGKNIKVISLFFIDKVKNYRTYEVGTSRKGKFAEWFEQFYGEFSQQPKYAGLIPFKADEVHNGYFAQDKKGVMKDSREGRASEDDASTFNLIMKDKERLLDAAEPLRFIFSHSALREGWDNPNVFQLCTLNESKSEVKKRQEIGRGLRLAVGSDGNRIFDRNINRLTVVANESYEDFARQLQNEIEKDTGERFERRIKNKANTKSVRLRKGYDLDPAFLDLWNRIKQKTTYRVKYDTPRLVEDAAKAIKDLPAISAPRIIFQKTGIQIVSEGIHGTSIRGGGYDTEPVKFPIPDIIGYLQARTNLTRGTIYNILKNSGRLGDALLNPQLFLDMAAATISRVLASRMIDGIKYEKIADDYYEMMLFEDGEVEQYLENLYIVTQQQKTLYNCITIDSMSEVERKFAEECDSREDVEFYFKLPRRFVIPTPIGNYTPDWAIVFKDEKRLYFVAETKGSINYDDLRHSESQKIRCGYRHFDEFKEQEVRFKHVTKIGELK